MLSRLSQSAKAAALSSFKASLYHPTRFAPSCSACYRHFSATSSVSLPRHVARTTFPSSSTPTPVSQEESATQPLSSDPNIPWFLESEQVDPPQQESVPTQLSTDHHFGYIPKDASDLISDAICHLQDQILSGPCSNLIARPSDEPDVQAPIAFIHPYSLSIDPDNDAYGKTDWIVVVQVKSSAAGSVRKVAIEIGNFLKRQRPPMVEDQQTLQVDDLLGPSKEASRFPKPSSSSREEYKKAAALGPRPKGVSRIEHELGKSLPEWAINRIALSRKFPDGWKPSRILSREAQDGIRLLHGSDPVKFDAEELSNRFRVSKESIRRILKGGKWDISGEARGRQDRRAKERAAENISSRPERWAREESELAKIRKMQEDGSYFLQDGESPTIESKENDASEPGFTMQIRYEGLVVSSSDAAAAGLTAKGPRKASPVSRGDGHWCLVDAEWCMVHVMTEQARYKYDLEGMWRELEAQSESKLPKVQKFVTDGAPSDIRSKRNVFGENLSKRHQRRGYATNAKADRDSDLPNQEMSFQELVEKLEKSIEQHESLRPLSLFRKPFDLPETIHKQLEFARQDERESGLRVVIEGWLRSVRKQKAVIFLEITDGTLPGDQTLQAVLRDSKGVEGLITGAAVRLRGELQKGRGTKPGQDMELKVEDIKVIGPCDTSNPLASQVKVPQTGAYSASLAERRESHLRAQLPRHAAVLRVRDRLERAMAGWFWEHSFVKVTAPILTSSDCEGAGEVFQVVADSDVRSLSPSNQRTSSEQLSSFWSGTPAYLTVSSQLHLEAMGFGLSRVWTLNPTFRAEGSATNRHLAEFWMLEAEIYWTGGEADGRKAIHAVMDCVEGVIKSGLRCIFLDKIGQEQDEARQAVLEFIMSEQHRRKLTSYVLAHKWPRITYTEAIEKLKARHDNAAFASEPVWGEGLSSEHERFLAARGPIFITDYPLSIKAFYMRRNPDDTVACFDLLIPKVGELVGGSLREERIDKLQQNMEALGVKEDAMTWYTQDLRKYGGAPHGGFGLGMERLVSWVTETENVRDVNTFARTKGPVRF